MKRILNVLLCCGLFASLSSYAQETATWDLARDLQTSFRQGADGVWYFMESEARVHDPSLYRLLPRYLAPCQNQLAVFAGVGCWQGTEAHTPGPIPGFGLKTEVGFNFTNKPVPYGESLTPYFPHSVHILPTWDRYGIVAWQSPLTGIVKVSGRFIWKTFIQIGLDWSVDKGNETLASRHIFLEDRQVFNLRVPVVKGDVLYFIVDDPWGCPSYCQPNPIDFGVTITQVQ